MSRNSTPATTDTPESPGGAASRPSKETNSVNSQHAGFDDSDDVVARRVSEFVSEYPELAEMPLSRTHGRKLRRICTEAEWMDVFVEPDQPTENAFYVTELERRESATWADALSAFLTAHRKYDGMLGRFVNDAGESIEVPLSDAWGVEYNQKQYARAKALQRQMAGGERPSGGESLPAWGDPVTIMLTFTASSTPGGERLPPVDHLDALHDAWSYDGVRDALRNTIEYHLGLDSEEWGYWLQTEPHGVGDAASPDEEPGANACYTHLHVAVYLDGDALEVDTDRLGQEMMRPIRKHLDVCEPAGPDAHTRDRAVSINEDVSNLGSYLAAYMGEFDEELEDRPIEYLAWGALYWSTSRRRTSRSQTVTAAIQADACHQRVESPDVDQSLEHGEQVEWSVGNAYDVVCSCCGSGWDIDQDRIDEPVADDDLREAVADGGETGSDLTPAQLWAEAGEFASVGETPARARVRSEIRRYLDEHDSPTVPEVLGSLGLAPRHRDLVEDVLDGRTEPESHSFQRPDPLGSEWELEAIIDRDGEEHLPGDGGVDMVPLHIPVEHLLKETRLQYSPKRGEAFRCSLCRVSTHDNRWMAHHLANEHGLEGAEEADSALVVHDYYGNQRECMTL